MLQKPGQAQGPEGLGVVLIPSQGLLLLGLLPPVSPQDRGYFHTLQLRGRKSFSLQL